MCSSVRDIIKAFNSIKRLIVNDVLNANLVNDVLNVCQLIASNISNSYL